MQYKCYVGTDTYTKGSSCTAAKCGAGYSSANEAQYISDALADGDYLCVVKPLVFDAESLVTGTAEIYVNPTTGSLKVSNVNTVSEATDGYLTTTKAGATSNILKIKAPNDAVTFVPKTEASNPITVEMATAANKVINFKVEISVSVTLTITDHADITALTKTEIETLPTITVVGQGNINRAGYVTAKIKDQAGKKYCVTDQPIAPSACTSGGYSNVYFVNSKGTDFVDKDEFFVPDSFTIDADTLVAGTITVVVDSGASLTVKNVVSVVEVDVDGTGYLKTTKSTAAANILMIKAANNEVTFVPKAGALSVTGRASATIDFKVSLSAALTVTLTNPELDSLEVPTITFEGDFLVSSINYPEDKVIINRDARQFCNGNNAAACTLGTCGAATYTTLYVNHFLIPGDAVCTLKAFEVDAENLLTGTLAIKVGTGGSLTVKNVVAVDEVEIAGLMKITKDAASSNILTIDAADDKVTFVPKAGAFAVTAGTTAINFNVSISADLDLKLINPVNKYTAPTVTVNSTASGKKVNLFNYPKDNVVDNQNGQTNAVTVLTKYYLLCKADDSDCTAPSDATLSKIGDTITSITTSTNNDAQIIVVIDTYDSAGTIDIETSTLNYQDIVIKYGAKGQPIGITGFSGVDQTNGFRLIGSTAAYGADIIDYTTNGGHITLNAVTKLDVTAGESHTDFAASAGAALAVTLTNAGEAGIDVPQITITSTDAVSLFYYATAKVTVNGGGAATLHTFCSKDAGDEADVCKTKCGHDNYDTAGSPAADNDVLCVAKNTDSYAAPSNEYHIIVGEGVSLEVTTVTGIAAEGSYLKVNGQATIENKGTLTIAASAQLTVSEMAIDLFASTTTITTVEDNVDDSFAFTGVTKLSGTATANQLKIGDYLTIGKAGNKDPAITITPITTGDKTLTITGSEAAALPCILKMGNDVIIAKGAGADTEFPALTIDVNALTGDYSIDLGATAFAISVINVDNVDEYTADTVKVWDSASTANDGGFGTLSILATGGSLDDKITLTTTSAALTVKAGATNIPLKTTKELLFSISLSNKLYSATAPKITLTSDSTFHGTASNIDYPKAKLYKDTTVETTNGYDVYCFQSSSECGSFAIATGATTTTTISTPASGSVLYIAAAGTYSSINSGVIIVFLNTNPTLEIGSNTHSIIINTGISLTVTGVTHVKEDTSKIVLGTSESDSDYKLTIDTSSVGTLIVEPAATALSVKGFVDNLPFNLKAKDGMSITSLDETCPTIILPLSTLGGAKTITLNADTKLLVTGVTSVDESDGVNIVIGDLTIVGTSAGTLMVTPSAQALTITPGLTNCPFTLALEQAVTVTLDNPLYGGTAPSITVSGASEDNTVTLVNYASKKISGADGYTIGGNDIKCIVSDATDSEKRDLCGTNCDLDADEIRGYLTETDIWEFNTGSTDIIYYCDELVTTLSADPKVNSILSFAKDMNAADLLKKTHQMVLGTSVDLIIGDINYVDQSEEGKVQLGTTTTPTLSITPLESTSLTIETSSTTLTLKGHESEEVSDLNVIFGSALTTIAKDTGVEFPILNLDLATLSGGVAGPVSVAEGILLSVSNVNGVDETSKFNLTNSDENTFVVFNTNVVSQLLVNAGDNLEIKGHSTSATDFNIKFSSGTTITKGTGTVFPIMMTDLEFGVQQISGTLPAGLLVLVENVNFMDQSSTTLILQKDSFSDNSNKLTFANKPSDNNVTIVASGSLVVKGHADTVCDVRVQLTENIQIEGNTGEVFPNLAITTTVSPKPAIGLKDYPYSNIKADGFDIALVTGYEFDVSQLTSPLEFTITGTSTLTITNAASVDESDGRVIIVKAASNPDTKQITIIDNTDTGNGVTIVPVVTEGTNGNPNTQALTVKRGLVTGIPFKVSCSNTLTITLDGDAVTDSTDSTELIKIPVITITFTSDALVKTTTYPKSKIILTGRTAINFCYGNNVAACEGKCSNTFDTLYSNDVLGDGDSVCVVKAGSINANDYSATSLSFVVETGITLTVTGVSKVDESSGFTINDKLTITNSGTLTITPESILTVIGGGTKTDISLSNDLTSLSVILMTQNDENTPNLTIANGASYPITAYYYPKEKIYQNNAEYAYVTEAKIYCYSGTEGECTGNSFGLSSEAFTYVSDFTDTNSEFYKDSKTKLLYIVDDDVELTVDFNELGDTGILVYLYANLKANNVLSRAHTIFVESDKTLTLTYVQSISESNGVITTTGSAPLTIYNYGGTIDITLDEDIDIEFTELSFTSNIVLHGYEANTVTIKDVTNIDASISVNELKIGDYLTIENIIDEIDDTIKYRPAITIVPTIIFPNIMRIHGSSTPGLNFDLELEGDITINQYYGHDSSSDKVPTIKYAYNKIGTYTLTIGQDVDITFTDVPNIAQTGLNQFEIKSKDESKTLTIKREGKIIITPLENSLEVGAIAQATATASEFTLLIDESTLIILKQNANSNNAPKINVGSDAEFITYYNYPTESIQYNENDYDNDKLINGTKIYCFGDDSSCLDECLYKFYPENIKSTFTSLPSLAADAELYIATSEEFGDVTTGADIIICNSDAKAKASLFSNAHTININDKAKLTLYDVDAINVTSETELEINALNKAKLTINQHDDTEGELMIVPSSSYDLKVTVTIANGPKFGLIISSPLLLTAEGDNLNNPPYIHVKGEKYITYHNYLPQYILEEDFDSDSLYDYLVASNTIYCSGTANACLEKSDRKFKYVLGSDSVNITTPTTGATIYVIQAISDLSGLKAGVKLYLYLDYSISLSQITTDNHIVQMRSNNTLTISGVTTVSASANDELTIGYLKVQKFEEVPKLVIQSNATLAVSGSFTGLPFNLVLTEEATEITGNDNNKPTITLDVSKISSAKNLTSSIKLDMEEVANIVKEGEDIKFVGAGQTSKLTVVNTGKLEVYLSTGGTVTLTEDDIDHELKIYAKRGNTISINNVTKISEDNSLLIGDNFVIKAKYDKDEDDDDYDEEYYYPNVILTLKPVEGETTLETVPSEGFEIDDLEALVEILTRDNYTIPITGVTSINSSTNGLQFNKILTISTNNGESPKLVKVKLEEGSGSSFYDICNLAESKFIYPVTITGQDYNGLMITDVSNITYNNQDNGLQFGKNLIIKTTSTRASNEQTRVIASLKSGLQLTFASTELTYELGIIGDNSNSILLNGISTVVEGKYSYLYNNYNDDNYYNGIMFDNLLTVYQIDNKIASITISPASTNSVSNPLLVISGDYLLGFGLKLSGNVWISLYVTGSNVENKAPYAPPITISVTETITTENKATITLDNYPKNKIKYGTADQDKLIINGITLYCLNSNQCGNVCFDRSDLDSGFNGYSGSQVNYTNGDILYVNRAGTDLTNLAENVNMYFCVSDSQNKDFVKSHKVKVQINSTLTISNVSTVNGNDGSTLTIDSNLILEKDIEESIPSLIIKPRNALSVDFASAATLFGFNIVLVEEATTITKSGSNSYQPSIILDVSGVSNDKNITIGENIALSMTKVKSITKEEKGITFVGAEQTAKLIVVNNGNLAVSLSEGGNVTLTEGDFTKNVQIKAKSGNTIIMNNVTTIVTNDITNDNLLVIDKVSFVSYYDIDDDDSRIYSRPDIKLYLKPIETDTALSNYLTVPYIQANVEIIAGEHYTIDLRRVTYINASTNGLLYDDLLTISKNANKLPKLVKVTLINDASKSYYVCNLKESDFIYPVEIKAYSKNKLIITEVTNLTTTTNGLRFKDSVNPKLTILKDDSNPTVYAALASSYSKLELDITTISYPLYISGVTRNVIILDKVETVIESVQNIFNTGNLYIEKVTNNVPSITVKPNANAIIVTAGDVKGGAIDFTISEVTSSFTLTLSNHDDAATAPKITLTGEATAVEALTGEDKILITVDKYPYRKLRFTANKVDTNDKVYMYCLGSSTDCENADKGKLTNGEYETPISSIEQEAQYDDKYKSYDIFYITKADADLLNILDNEITIVVCNGTTGTKAAVGTFTTEPEVFIRSGAELTITEAASIIYGTPSIKENYYSMKVGYESGFENCQIFNAGKLIIRPSINNKQLNVGAGGYEFDLDITTDLTIGSSIESGDTKPTINVDVNLFNKEYSIDLPTYLGLKICNIDYLDESSDSAIIVKDSTNETKTLTLTSATSNNKITAVPKLNDLSVIGDAISINLEISEPLLLKLETNNGPQIDVTSENYPYLTYVSTTNNEQITYTDGSPKNYKKKGKEIYCVGTDRDNCLRQTQIVFSNYNESFVFDQTNWNSNYELYIAKAGYNIVDTVKSNVEIYIYNTGISSSLKVLTEQNKIYIQDGASFTLSDVNEMFDGEKIEIGGLKIYDEADGENQLIIKPLVKDHAGSLKIEIDHEAIPFQLSLEQPLYLALEFSDKVKEGDTTIDKYLSYTPNITVNSATSQYITYQDYPAEKLLSNPTTQYPNVKDYKYIYCIGKDIDCTDNAKIKFYNSDEEIDEELVKSFEGLDEETKAKIELYIATKNHVIDYTIPDKLKTYISTSGVSSTMDTLNNEHIIIIQKDASLTLSNMKTITEKDGKTYVGKLTITEEGELKRECAVGYGSNLCNICEAGKFSLGGSTAATEGCDTCTIGNWSVPGSGSCPVKDIYLYCGERSKCSSISTYENVNIYHILNTDSSIPDSFEKDSLVVIYPTSYSSGLSIDISKFDNQKVIIPTTKSSLHGLDSNSLTIGPATELTAKTDKSTQLKGDSGVASFPESDDSYLVVSFEDVLIIKQEEGAQLTNSVALAPQAEEARIQLDSSVNVENQKFTIAEDSTAKSLYVFVGEQEVSKDQMNTFIDKGESDISIKKKEGEATSIKHGLSGGAIAGIVIACLVVAAAVVVIVIVVLKKKKNSDDSPPV